MFYPELVSSGAIRMIPLNLPKIGEEEIEAVIKVMKSGMLTSVLGAGLKVRV